MYDLAKEAWLKALRSGEYRQGTSYLAYTDTKNSTPTYCCLGVLCEVAVRNGANVTKDSPDGFMSRYDKEAGVLPKSVQEWAGLHSAEPGVTFEDNIDVPLTVINDDYGLSFEEIAELVEEQL
jgi:hypothetical protein